MYSVGTLKADITRKLHGTTLSKVQDVDGLLDEAARNVLIRLDPHETRRISQLDTPLYDNVYRYTSPVDLKGNRIIDIRPQVDRRQSDNFTQTYGEAFDINKSDADNLFTVAMDSSIKFLNIAKEGMVAGVTLHRMDSIGGNGAWAVGGDAQNLSEDTLNKVSGNASLRFDLDGLTTEGYLENSTMTPIDLTEQLNIGAIFVRVWVPDASEFTSLTLRWGSGASAYWEVTVTETHDKLGVQNGWNRFRFDWSIATQVGSPDVSAINYLRPIVTYDGTANTDYRIDDIVAQVGTVFEIVYYTKYMFRDALTGAFLENVDDDSNLINLDTETYNILLYEAMLLVGPQVQGEDTGFDTSFYSSMLFGDGSAENIGMYRLYKGLYKSETEKPRQNYYKMPRQNRRP